jgi:hypothetical protein
MKPMSIPSMFTGMNLTQDELEVFFKKNVEFVTSNATNQNKSIDTLQEDDLTNSTRSPDCLGYCDSEMLDIFKSYKTYHGYVTLVVS